VEFLTSWTTISFSRRTLLHENSQYKFVYLLRSWNIINIPTLSLHVNWSCPWHSPSIIRSSHPWAKFGVVDSCTANVSWWAMLPDVNALSL
jgi:hypothetical protein